MIAYFSHGYLCRRRHKLALIAESNLKFDSRFLRRKESSAEWRLVCKMGGFLTSHQTVDKAPSCEGAFLVS